MPIIDHFKDYATGPTAPITGGFDILPSDTVDLPVLTRAVIVGAGGDVTLDFADGTTLTLPSLAEGVIYPVRAARVRATGTTAADIKGLF